MRETRSWICQAVVIVTLRPVDFWTSSWWRQCLRLLCVLAYGYLLLGSVLFAMQERLAFPVWGFGLPQGQPPEDLEFSEIQLIARDGNSILAWWLQPRDWNAQQGAVLYSYGSRQSLVTAVRNMARWRDKLGVAVLGYDYPGHGGSAGCPREESCYLAAEVAWDHITSRGVDTANIILVGESRGGAMATELASRQPARMLVLVGCPTSFPDVAQDQIPLFPTRWLARYRFDTISKLPDLKLPVFIAHGAADRVVTVCHAERNYRAANEPKRFLVLDNHPHMHPERAEFFQAVQSFLAETRVGQSVPISVGRQVSGTKP